MSKHRSRRQRKKLHVGEFQEFGFALKTLLHPEMRDDAFIDALLAEAVAPRGLVFDGWAQGGFVTKAVRGSVTAEDRDAVMAWLRTRTDLQSARASELIDAWYTDFVPDTDLRPV